MYPRAVRLAVVLLTALALAGCGGYGDGGNADVENAVASAVQDVLTRDAPLVELRAVTCSGQRPSIACRVDLGVGDHRATAWGSDLTEQYIKINAEYTT